MDSLNQSYLIFRSVSSKYDRTFSSDIVNATQNPVWNTNHIFLGVDSEEWASSKLEISVWNYSNHLDHKCLGMKIYIDGFIEMLSIGFQIRQKKSFPLRNCFYISRNRHIRTRYNGRKCFKCVLVSSLQPIINRSRFAVL